MNAKDSLKINLWFYIIFYGEKNFITIQFLYFHQITTNCVEILTSIRLSFEKH